MKYTGLYVTPYLCNITLVTNLCEHYQYKSHQIELACIKHVFAAIAANGMLLLPHNMRPSHHSGIISHDIYFSIAREVYWTCQKQKKTVLILAKRSIT